MSRKRLGRMLDGILAMVLIFIMAAAITYAQLQPQETAKDAGQLEKEVVELKGLQKYVEIFKASIEDLDYAAESLDAASEAIDSGDTEIAKAQSEKAGTFLAPVKDSMNEYISEMTPVINSLCPVSGLTIDQAKVPKAQTRMYKDSKIGFCSLACPATWDDLSDAERGEKLKKVVSQETFENMFQQEQKEASE